MKLNGIQINFEMRIIIGCKLIRNYALNIIYNKFLFIYLKYTYIFKHDFLRALLFNSLLVFACIIMYVKINLNIFKESLGFS